MKRHVLTALIGFGGMVLALALWHVYLDHASWHAFVNDIARAQQQARQQQAPKPGP